MRTCVHCICENRKNNHRLDPLLCPITYDSSDIITNFSIPRKYTDIHDAKTSEVFISVGENYNKSMLESKEAVELESQIVGKWCIKNNKYIILLEAIISSEKNPQSEIRNTIICDELGLVIEAIGLAETSLVKLNPDLSKTKIYVNFKSIDSKYARTEYWGRLEKWQ